MDVKIKKILEGAIEPTKGTGGSAGFDLYAINTEVISCGETKMFHTGWAFEIPEGHAGMIYARSGLATKKGARPATCVSVIDSDYRGEVTVPLHNDSKDLIVGIEKGDRIAQLVIHKLPDVTLVVSDELSNTKRGVNGYGSSGK